MSEGFIKKFKDWMSVEEEYEEDIENEEVQEEEYEEAKTDIKAQPISKKSNVVTMHTNNQMKVVIVEPKKYDDVTIIADHLRQRRTAIVNLESLEDDPKTRQSIYDFICGAVYVLEGNMQKVSKSIIILTPHNVDIDANIKKELESKAFFPWQK